jgi:hypothetical protein
MLSFILTADNYPVLLDFPLQNSLYYAVFFVATSLVGLFVFSSLVIASFEEEYSKLHARSVQAYKCVLCCDVMLYSYEKSLYCGNKG